jgi:hypothetical protein
MALKTTDSDRLALSHGGNRLSEKQRRRIVNVLILICTFGKKKFAEKAARAGKFCLIFRFFFAPSQTITHNIVPIITHKQ